MEAWALPTAVAAFVGAALVIAVVGSRLARIADRLADQTGLGEAVTGGLLLGGATSLPGIVTTAVGAAEGEGGFAISNALGGIAVQTLFIAVADIGFRRANLEHAAASVPNLVQAALLAALLSLVLIAIAGPETHVLGIHPVSVVVAAVYLWGVRASHRAHRLPMWQPRRTSETVVDVPAEEGSGPALPENLVVFAAHAAVVGAAGYVVGRAGLSIAARSGLSGVEVATLLTSVVTSLPELVVLLAAVRMRALTLGVGNVIGGNAFDMLFIPVADVAYRQGSVYHDVDDATVFVLGVTLTLTATLLVGLIGRQEAGIGIEGAAIIGVYLVGVAILVAGF